MNGAIAWVLIALNIQGGAPTPVWTFYEKENCEAAAKAPTPGTISLRLVCIPVERKGGRP